jgi:hypothetical protein
MARTPVPDLGCTEAALLASHRIGERLAAEHWQIQAMVDVTERARIAAEAMRPHR